jgi:precorrin-6x reductase
VKRNLLIFGGTSEGRLLCERLSRAGGRAVACTATAHGARLISGLAGIRPRAGRLDVRGMIRLMDGGGFDMVVDATHPYAQEVSATIRAACAATGLACVRVARGACDCRDGYRVANIEDAVDFLARTEGTVLLATGSRDLEAFRRLPDFRTRLYARVLPVPEVVARCLELGFPGDHLAAMQGPFSYEMNLAMLRHWQCRWLATKNSGAAGGMEAKMAAARDAGAQVLMIDRPPETDGMSLEAVLRLLQIHREET